MKWFVYALLAMVVFSGMILIFKKLMLMGVKSSVLLFFVFLFGMLFYLSHLVVTKTSFKVNFVVVLLVVLAAFLSYAGNFLQLKSMELSPNPGYSIGVVSLQAVVITLASVLLFHSSLSWINGIGVALAVVALVLMGL
jgi:drug/metabolite transporter (DMT)-like permease